MINQAQRVIAALVLAFGNVQYAAAQTGGFTPGSRELFSTDFSKTKIGDFPEAFDPITGTAKVVEKNGARMLRAGEFVEFLVHLNDRLPEAFTIEFDVIPKADGAPEDISFEGTATISRSETSSHVVINGTTIIVVGGGETFQIPTPQALAETMPNVLTHFGVSIDANGMDLYANGQLIKSLGGRKFARGQVLRVALGGAKPYEDPKKDEKYAVYLSKLRIGTGGTPPTLAGNDGPTLQASSTSSSASSTSSLSTSPNTQTEPRSGFAVTVTMGSTGPLVSWPVVPEAGGYSVSRQKVGDTCCNNDSGRGYTATSPWQDKALPSSGTYSYLVLATTPAGTVRAETQFSYTAPAPVSAVLATPTTTATGMVTTSTSSGSTGGTSTSGTTGGTGSTVVGGSTATQRTVTSVTGGGTSGGSTTGGSASGTSSGPGDVPPTYRVTLTGFRVVKTTGEPTAAPDGRYDEAYAAAAIIRYDRTTLAVGSRATVQTREYGDIGTVAGFYLNRIKAGTATAQGGLWTGNGSDRVPAEFDPSGSNIPASTNDQFPLLVWEGTLAAGVDALLVVPSVWDKDVDSSPFTAWKQGWMTASLPSLFNSTAVMNEMSSTQLTTVISQASVGTQYILTIPDAAAHIKDRPIGMETFPPNLPPAGIVYKDRHVMITQEKLAGLALGSSTTLSIPLAEPIVPLAAGAIYTLYLRVERTK